jgi:hypothetical protein
MFSFVIVVTNLDVMPFSLSFMIKFNISWLPVWKHIQLLSKMQSSVFLVLEITAIKILNASSYVYAIFMLSVFPFVK